MKYYLILLIYLTSCVGVNKEVLEFGLNSKINLKNGQKQVVPNALLLKKFTTNCQSELLNNYLNKVFLVQNEYTTFISLVTSKETSNLDSLMIKDTSFEIKDTKIFNLPNEINDSVKFYVFKMEKLKLVKFPFIRIAYKEAGLSNIVFIDIFLDNSQSEDSFFNQGTLEFIKNIGNIKTPNRN